MVEEDKNEIVAYRIGIYASKITRIEYEKLLQTEDTIHGCKEHGKVVVDFLELLDV